MRLTKQKQRARRAQRAKARNRGTATKPRLVVFRSLRHISAQLINDQDGNTIVAANDQETDSKGDKTEKAKVVGKSIATKAIKAGIKTVVFDTNGNQYHGRVAQLADSAREGGLKF